MNRGRLWRLVTLKRSRMMERFVRRRGMAYWARRSRCQRPGRRPAPPLGEANRTPLPAPARESSWSGSRAGLTRISKSAPTEAVVPLIPCLDLDYVRPVLGQ